MDNMLDNVRRFELDVRFIIVELPLRYGKGDSDIDRFAAFLAQNMIETSLMIVPISAHMITELPNTIAHQTERRCLPFKPCL